MARAKRDVLVLKKATSAQNITALRTVRSYRGMH